VQQNPKPQKVYRRKVLGDLPKVAWTRGALLQRRLLILACSAKVRPTQSLKTQKSEPRAGAMATSPHYLHHLPRNAAMPEDGRNSGDERSHRERQGRGMNSDADRPLDRSFSSYTDRRAREERRRGRSDRLPENRQGARPRDRSAEGAQSSQPAARHRRRSRDRGGNGPPPSHRPPSKGFRSPRDRDSVRLPGSAPDDPRPPRPTWDEAKPGENSIAPRNDLRASSHAKRPRSPDYRLDDSQAKRSRRDFSPRRDSRNFAAREAPGGGGAGGRGPPRPRSISPPRRSRSPVRRERLPKNKKKSRNSRPSHIRPSRSRSPRRNPGPPSSENPNLCPLGEPRGGARSRSPPHPPRNRSHSRPRSPPPSRGGPPPIFSDTNSFRGRSPDHDPRRPLSPSHRDHPPRSPRSRKEGRSGKKSKRRDERRRRASTPELASGANSVEVNMAARGGFRGGFNQMQGPYPKGQFQDGRRFSQSSGHGTPNSFHGSQPNQSPYAGSQGWGGSQQFSPQR